MATANVQSGPNTKWWGRTDVDAARDRLADRLWRTATPVVASPGCNPRFVVDVAGACARPVVIDDVRRAPREDGSPYMHVGKGPLRHQAMIWVTIIARCRHCMPCLNHRSDLIAERTRREFLDMEKFGGRAWFASLTLDPVVRRELANAAFKAAGFPKDGQVIAVDGDGEIRTIWGPHARSMGLIAGIKKLGQAFVKSLRKRTKLKARQLRYLIVVELHKDGWPHLHAIIIESGGTREVTWRRLKSCWPDGHFKANVVRKENDGYSRSAYYTAKYLTKEDVHSRIMMSHHWGDPGHVPDVREPVRRPLMGAKRWRPKPEVAPWNLPVPGGRIKPGIRDEVPSQPGESASPGSDVGRAESAEQPHQLGLGHSAKETERSLSGIRHGTGHTCNRTDQFINPEHVKGYEGKLLDPPSLPAEPERAVFFKNTQPLQREGVSPKSEAPDTG